MRWFSIILILKGIMTFYPEVLLEKYKYWLEKETTKEIITEDLTDSDSDSDFDSFWRRRRRRRRRKSLMKWTI